MESDRILMGVVAGAALVGVSAFVLWPNNARSRLRQRRGQISGLINFGNTCFLNAILQSLASSPQFLSWIQLHDSTYDKKSLISSLLTILECINGTHSTIRTDPSNPAAVIRALNNLGWVIPEQEHDPHELFHVILTSIEEESMKPKKIGCLSDALGDITAIQQPLPCRPSSAMLTEFDKDNYNESSSLLRLVRSEAQTPESNQSTVDENESIDHSMFDDDEKDKSIQDSPPSIISATSVRQRNNSNNFGNFGNGDAFNNRRNHGSYRSLDRLSRGPGRVSVWNANLTKQIAIPFKGSLSSQLTCSSCNYKSVVRVDKFESITLNLPENSSQQSLLSLGQLLGEYVQPETVTDVECESCSQISNHNKIITFTKLPPCLAIHISRTSWTNGYSQKRSDFVHFPESLSMAPYSFIQPSLSSQCSTPWGSTMSLYSASLANMTPTNENMQFGSPFASFGGFPRNLYRLLAVVVHNGDASSSGHFITYRRGSLRNYHKWYLTSDHLVKEVSIEEVLSSPAYMLFYDRSHNRN